MFDYSSLAPVRHIYTLTTIGLKKNYDKQFCSREAANRFMYDICGKYDLRIVDSYDDKHDKTYKCSNGGRFFIQRV